MGIHEIPKRDRSVWWLWVGIFALVALLMYVAMHAFSTSSEAPVAKADQGIEVDANGWQDANQAPPKARKGHAPVPAPTVTLQGYSKTVPGPEVTVTKTAVTPGPTIMVTPPAATVTKSITAKPAPTTTRTIVKPGPTVTKTVTSEPEPAPTVTVTIEVPVPGPTVTERITLEPSPSGGESP
jgi:hypothetical protein